VALRYRSLYPFLFAAVRVLFLGANNPGNYDLDDLLLVLLVTQAGVMTLYLLAWVTLARFGEDVPALATLVVVAWLIVSPAVEEWFPELLRQLLLVLVGLGGVASVLLIVGLAARPATLRLGARLLTLVYLLLAVWLGRDIARDRADDQRQVAASPLVRDLARPIPSRPAAGGPLRDIYVIMLDEYANAATLRAVLGFDNSAFVDSLRALGFRVPRAVRSNYTQTSLSLAAFLNAAHVYRIEQELPPGSTDAVLINHLVEYNRVARYARARGYRFVFFPSSWWYATRWSPIADSVVEVDTSFSIGREMSRTEFRTALWHNSMVAWFHREEEGAGKIVRGTLEGLGRLPADRRPVFAFAHVLSPHVPYVFDSTCREREHVWKRHPAGYTAQLQCVNRLVLAMVTRLLAESEVQPVIILQGDHGTAFLEYSSAGNPTRVHPTAAGERFGAFGAYLLPGGGAAALGDTVTVVNVLGHVLRTYLGADLPLEADDQYLSVDPSPFDLHRVRPTWPGLGDTGAARSPILTGGGRVVPRAGAAR
jgi:hypothetical protein